MRRKKNVTKHSPYASALILNIKFIEVGCGAICRRRSTTTTTMCDEDEEMERYGMEL
jgi:hypothetical protein